VTHEIAAGIYDKCVGRQQRCNVFEKPQTLVATCNQARSWRIEEARCAFNLGYQCRDTSLARGAFGPTQGCVRLLHSQTPDCDSRDDELVKRPRCGRKKTRVKVGKHTLRLIEVPD
jgi:hypothetical protein